MFPAGFLAFALISFDDFHVGIKGDRTGIKKACESRSGLFSVLIGGTTAALNIDTVHQASQGCK